MDYRLAQDFQLRVAMNVHGDALILSNHATRSGRTIIEARARSSAGRYGPIETISDEIGSTRGLQLVIDSDGDALIVWEPSKEGAARTLIQARARSSAGTHGPIETVHQLKNGGEAGPQVAMNGAGDALILWSSRVNTGLVGVQVRARSATGAYGPVEILSEKASRHVSGRQIRIDPVGRSVAVWSSSDGTSFRVQAATSN